MTLLDDPSREPALQAATASNGGGLLGDMDIGGALGTIRDRFAAYAQSPEGRIMIAHIGAASGPSRRPGGLQRGIASGMLAVQQYEEQQKRYLQRKKLQDAQLAEHKRRTEKDEGKAAALARAVAAGYGATDFARQPDTNKQFDPRLAAPHLMEAGQVNAALNALKPKPQENYGQPTAGIGPDGKPTFMRFGNRGGQQSINDFRPMPKRGAQPRLHSVYDRELKQTRFVTAQEIKANSRRYGPISGSGKQRRIVKGADGYQYYADKGERVLPGVDNKSGGNLTPVQMRENAEIDQHRAQLRALGITSREELQKRTQKVTGLGRDNALYDPNIAKLVNKALQRKTGDDPEYESLYSQLYSGLRADLKKKADIGIFTKAELRKLRKDDRAQFDKLKMYLDTPPGKGR